MIKVGDYCVVVKEFLCGTGIVESIVTEKRVRIKMLDGYTIDSGRMLHVCKKKRNMASIKERFHKNILDDLGGYSPEDDYVLEVERRQVELDKVLDDICSAEEENHYCFARLSEIDIIPYDINESLSNLPRLIWNTDLSTENKRDMIFSGEALLFDPEGYDKAIIAYSNGVVYYTYEGIVDATFEMDQSCDPHDHVSYNMLGSVCGDIALKLKIVDELDFHPDPEEEIETIKIKGTNYQVVS